MNTVSVEADGQPMEIDAKTGLTLICHPGEMDVQVVDPRYVEINPEGTVAWSNALPAEHWTFLRAQPGFLKFWNTIWTYGGVEVPPPENLARANLAMRHVVGMIMLIRETMAQHKQPFIRLPETYLHPKQQVNLGDFFITLNGGK